MKYETDNPECVAKEALWLAYKAADPPMRAGRLQQNPLATKEEVIENVRTEGDYPGEPHAGDGELRADYVFGKMIKTTLAIHDDFVRVVTGGDPKPNYQSWCKKYESWEDLLSAAERSAC